MRSKKLTNSRIEVPCNNHSLKKLSDDELKQIVGGTIAVGMTETLGFPAVVEAADAVVKAS